MKILATLALNLFLAASAMAAPSSSIVVGAERITVPIPPGFANAATTVPTAIPLAESMTLPDHRLQLLFMSNADVAREKAGRTAEWDRFFVVQTARAFEQRKFSEQTFAGMRSGLKQQQAELLARFRAAAQQSLARKSDKIGSTIDPFSMTLGETMPLGVLVDGPDALAFSTLTRYAIKTGNQSTEVPMVVTMAVLLVRQKLVFFMTYGVYRNKADVAQLQQAAKTWLAATTAANASGKPTAGHGGP